MIADDAKPARGAYSERVRRYFWQPAHAGDAPTEHGPVITAEASEGGAGARILLTAVTEHDRLIALRYRVFGCPHLIAATEAVCERFEGGKVQSLADFDIGALASELELPIEKTGRLLLLEDALRSLGSQLDQDAGGGT